MGFKTITPGQKPLASDLNQIIQALTGQADLGNLQLTPSLSTPATPTLTAGSTGILNGAYNYQLVYVTGFVESDDGLFVSGFASGSEGTITVTSKQVNVTIPAFSAPTIAVLIYRTIAGGATGSEEYAGIFTSSAGGTFVDNLADASLGTGMPNSSSSPKATGTTIPATVPISNTTGMLLTVPSGMKVKGKYTGTANYAWVGFYEVDGTTQQGYVGVPNGSTDSMYVKSIIGDVVLSPASGRVVKTDRNILDDGTGASTFDGTVYLNAGVLGATKNVNAPPTPVILAASNPQGVGMTEFGDLVPINPSAVQSGTYWTVKDKNGNPMWKVYLTGGAIDVQAYLRCYGGLWIPSGQSTWLLNGIGSNYSQSISALASGSSITITHNLGHQVPIVAHSGTMGNLNLTYSFISATQMTLTNYSSGSNAWTGTIYLW